MGFLVVQKTNEPSKNNYEYDEFSAETGSHGSGDRDFQTVSNSRNSNNAWSTPLSVSRRRNDLSNSLIQKVRTREASKGSSREKNRAVVKEMVLHELSKFDKEELGEGSSYQMAEGAFKAAKSKLINGTVFSLNEIICSLNAEDEKLNETLTSTRRELEKLQTVQEYRSSGMDNAYDEEELTEEHISQREKIAMSKAEDLKRLLYPAMKQRLRSLKNRKRQLKRKHDEFLNKKYEEVQEIRQNELGKPMTTAFAISQLLKM